MKILGITGHRPKSLYGYNDASPGNMFIIRAMGDFFQEYQPDKIITGMALGTDQWAAQWAIKLKIPFLAAIPNEQQDFKWPEESQKKYRWLLTQAAEINTTAKPNELANSDVSIVELMHKRNRYIVDNSDSMLAIFGGSPGGTRNCLIYAQEQSKRIDIINPGDYYKNN